MSDEAYVEADTEVGAFDRETKVVELIRLDYDATLRAMTGFIGSAAQVRALGIAAWGVVVGFAVRSESALLGAVALVLVALFVYADAFHAALYRRALARAIHLEELLDSYLERLGISADDPDEVARVLAKLETHKFGMHRALRPVRLRDLASARPKAIYWVIYPAVLLLTTGLTVTYAY